ncbi:MAG: 50S ribosomal protein L21 [Candidatus Anoxychlamydiales bacterium]|nr:50S ribosomal protein L21 [Candidatus Anoxychlamydiales bacterium]
MYAIIQTGGKQYKIEEKSILDVELIDAKDGKIEFNDVLLLNDGKKIVVGTPYIKNCKIKAEILKEVKGPKVIAYKYKKRKNYRRKRGHRQKYSKVQITKIEMS